MGGRRGEQAGEGRGFNPRSASTAHRRAPGGYRLCPREPLAGMTLEETDDYVRANGGWRLDEGRSSSGARDKFYVLPLSAFHQP